MRSKEDAEMLARDALRALGPDYIITGGSEHLFGWIFGWGARVPGLCGNAPIIVDRVDGSVHFTGTGRPAAVYMEAYSRFGPAAFAERRWEEAISRQEQWQWRAHAEAKRAGTIGPQAAVQLVIDWDDVARQLVEGLTEPPPRWQETRCYYCDVVLWPSQRVEKNGRIACAGCASRP